MATFTVTTDVNADTLTSKAGADTYNVNGTGARLTFDGDTRYDLNGNTSAAIGNVTPSATLGGTVKIDGSASWLIPYTAGAGLVPAAGTVIAVTGGSAASGKLVGVYSALNVAPTAAAAAMPASGYIKVKQWNGTLYGTTAILSGITATTGAGEKYGWVEFVATEGLIWTVNSVNNIFGGVAQTNFQGTWYNLGTTSGSSATTYQIPSNGVNQYHGGVFVDNATPITISSASWSSGTATINSTAHGAVTGQTVIIDGCTPLAWNVTGQITKVTADQFTIAIASNPGTMTGFGTTSIPEFYPMTDGSALSTVVATDSLRGKWCWISTAGLLTFQNDGTNTSGGYLPPSGRVIRIGNVFMTACTSAAKTQNSVNTTLNSRFNFKTDLSGVLSMDKVSCTWRMNNMNTPAAASITNTGFCTSLGFQGPASTKISLVNIGIGSIAANTTNVVNLTSLSGGVDIYDSVFGAGTMSSKTNFGATTVNNLTMRRCKMIHTGDAGSASGISITTSNNITISDSTFAGGSFNGQQSAGTNSVTNTTFYSSAWGKGSPTNNISIIALTNVCSGWTWDGFTTGGLVGQGMRSNLIQVSGGTSNCTFKNFGTADAPLDFRDSFGWTSATWTRSTTTATITKTSHGLATGDQIYVNWSSDITAITTVSKQPITVVDPNTFTFVCLNAGAASGSIGYEYSSIGQIINTFGDNFTVQNVHVLGNGSAYAPTNAFTTLRLENVTSDTKIADGGFSGNTMKIDSAVYPNRTPVAFPTACFGTAIISQYLTPYNTTYSGSAVAWTRVTTTITVTSTAHGLVTNDRVYVLNSSDPTATSWGLKVITVTGADTFTYTGVNSGAASGTFDYRVPDGRFAIVFDQGNAASTMYTIDSGTDIAFTGAGGLTMPTIGNQVTYTATRLRFGFNTFSNIVPQMTGGTITDYDITYDLDRGSGFSGTFNNASYPRAGGGGTAASTNVTMTSTTGVNAGDYVYGQGIAEGAKVNSITNSTTVVVSVANTAAVTGILQFSQLPNESALPSTGVYLKVRIKTTTTNTSAITFLALHAQSTNASRVRLYDQSITVAYAVTALDSTLAAIQNARVFIKAASGGPATAGTVIYNGLTDASGNIAGSYSYTGDQPITGWVRKQTSAPFYKQAIISGTIKNTGFTTTVVMAGDS